MSVNGHTHSNYALTSHTHSNYALTSHTHSGYASKNHTHSQYVTEVDINQMIEDVIDGYVPTIQTMGQVGNTGRLSGGDSKTISIPSSANVFIYATSYGRGSPIISLRGGNRAWMTFSPTDTLDITSTATSITFTVTNSNHTIYYVYF